MTETLNDAATDPQQTIAGLQRQLAERTAERDEALERLTASADILTVIASSPSDVKPVFASVVQAARRLLGREIAAILLCGDNATTFTPVAITGPDGLIPILNPDPIKTDPNANFPSRAIVSKKIQHLPNWSAIDLPEEERNIREIYGLNSALYLPMLRGGECIGVLLLGGKQPGSFSEADIDLAESFRDQAVIAIENARLFEEVQAKTRDLSESLQQQTATADVLKVISRSAFNLDAVLETLISTATRLCNCGPKGGQIFRREGDVYRYAASQMNVDPDYLRHEQTAEIKPGRGTLIGRVALSKRTVMIADAWSDPEYEEKDAAQTGNVRAMLGVPLLRDGEPIGAFALARSEPIAFTEREVELVNSFADQAVIAIENARLFNETKEALERQTATADVLKIIAASPTDVQPVFEAIVQTAVRLLRCETSFIQRCDRSSFWSVARCRKEGLLPLLNPRPGPIDPAANFPSRAIVAKKTLYLPDWSEIELPEFERRIQQELGYNCAIYLPLLHKDECLGVLGIAGSRPRMFGEADIALAEAFRDQAVIAIRNTQLFEEVQQRTRELSQSLEDLRTAQDRLVQTEKLASLGQLTAGIAHEIKNPLNFVNNFSALSVELIDEMTDVFENPALDEAARRKELDEIRELLKSNLEKVVQHGKRADSIVKNMLLHSREGSGEQRAVDINALLEESLNLAYHGARAEKPGFNITLLRDFDPVTGLADVYPQEIIRVLLNLISNGFYAATRRAADSGDGFEPTLRAATKNLGDRIEIRIRDNGTGIAPEVKEKIFNPFFTTKPAGEGTGLGLSMSHDIVVKQHGGTINVDSEPGIFTEFIINLPRATVTQKAAGGTT